jgi:acyl transferase domain-containing protein
VSDQVNKKSMPSGGEGLSALQRAALTIKELRTKLDAAKQSGKDPIAIVGMSCKFPGASNLDEYWQLLSNGVDAVSEVPKSRWDLEKWFDPNPATPGKINTRYGGFIEGVQYFDAPFFGIPPREAKLMDPGQRILLELVWAALEHAGIPPDSLKGSNTGFFVGMSQNDYGSMQINGDPEEISAYSGTGNGYCFASGRIAYQFGFHGPTMTSDTACSSSIVALYQAVNAIRNGESNLAIASGVQLNLTPPMQVFFSRTQSFSPDGKCFTFDERANGFILGEGVGVVVLQKLSEAVKQGRRIFGVIRETCLNHGGAAVGLTVPNETAQEMLIRHTLQRGKIDPDSIDYIETHGTGTNLGDPIEVGALKSVFGQRNADNPLFLGSVKTNIGHLNAAAGIAGLIKTVLMLNHGQIAPNLHFKKPNPKIPWDGFAAKVPTELMPWSRVEGRARRAGVSSFGLSGTNGHVILEEAPDEFRSQVSVGVSVAGATGSGSPGGDGVVSATGSGSVRDAAEAPEVGAGTEKMREATDAQAAGVSEKSGHKRSSYIFTISAKSATNLRALAVRHLDFIAKHRDSLNMVDYCFTANVGRSHLDHRAVVLAGGWDELMEGLAAIRDEKNHPKVSTGVCKKRGAIKNVNNIVESSDDLKQACAADGFFDMDVHREKFYQVVTDLHLNGWNLDWRDIESENGQKLITLPTYPFSRDRHWVDVKKDQASDVSQLKIIEENQTSKNLRSEIQNNDFSASNGENGISVGSSSNLNSSTDQDTPSTPSHNDAMNAVRRDAPSISLPGLMEMQLKLATEALKSVTDQQFDFLRSNLGTKAPSNHQNGSSSAPGSHPAGAKSTPESQPAETNSKTESSNRDNQKNEAELQLDSEKNATRVENYLTRNEFKITDKEQNTSINPLKCGEYQVLLREYPSETDLAAAKLTIADELSKDEQKAQAQSLDQISNAPTGKRLMMVYQNKDEAIATLQDPETKKIIVAEPPKQSPGMIFMFPGIGDHYLNMGKGLYQNDPAFRATIDYCCELVKPITKIDLREVMYPVEPTKTVDKSTDPSNSTKKTTDSSKANGSGSSSSSDGVGSSSTSTATAQPTEKPKFDFKAMLGRGTTVDPLQKRMNETRFSQPLLFIIEYALGKLWLDRGVKPDAMIGYSIGEYAAAVLSGVMSLDDALNLVTRRAELIETIPNGTMLAVPLSESETEKLLTGALSIAICSTPNQMVVAGPVAEIESLEKSLLEKDVMCRRLQSTHAFHTDMLRPLHEPLLELVKTFKLNPPTIPFISNVTGNWIQPDEATNPDYWARHTWQKVRFAEGMAHLLNPSAINANKSRIFLEVGPGVSLGSFMLQHPDAKLIPSKVNLPSLRTMYERTPDEQFLLNTTGKLFMVGYQFSTDHQSIRSIS